jgi:hypothetical protein
MVTINSKTASTQKNQHRATVLVLLFALALLWTQMLGQVHRMVHAPHGVTVAGASQAMGAPEAHGGHAGVLAHFSAHQGQDHEPDCQRYDQLGHADAPLATPAVLLPTIVPGFLALAPAYQVDKRQHAPFGARAPPVTG